MVLPAAASSGSSAGSTPAGGAAYEVQEVTRQISFESGAQLRATRYGAAERWRSFASSAVYRPTIREVNRAILGAPRGGNYPHRLPRGKMTADELRARFRRAGWRATIQVQTRQAALVLGVSERQIQRLVKRGEISLRIKLRIELPAIPRGPRGSAFNAWDHLRDKSGGIFVF